jgi:hypothetical protein
MKFIPCPHVKITFARGEMPCTLRQGHVEKDLGPHFHAPTKEEWN